MPAKSPKKKGQNMDIVVERRVNFNRKAYMAKKAGAKGSREVVEAIWSPHFTPAKTTIAPSALIIAVRSLNRKEERLILREFLKLNGVFVPRNKDCSRIRALLPDDITVRQVSGYVTKLHKQVAAGNLELEDRRAYLATLRAHRKHWLTYNGEKYDEMRERVKTTGRKPVYVARAGQDKETTPRHRMVK